MIEAIAPAIASAIANESAGKIREIIEQSDSQEEAWKTSCYELAIKIRTSFEQNQRVDSHDDDRFSRELEKYGSIARELSIYGETKGFDEDLRQTLEELAEGCANTARSSSGIGNTLEPVYREENIPSNIEDVFEEVDAD